MPPKKQETEIRILKVEYEHVQVAVVGTSPLICNRVSEKAKRELLMPKGKKTESEKRQNLKHVPLDEFRASPYTLPDNDAPTLLAALSVWFKKAMMTAALDLPGAKKAQIGRLLRVEGERIPLYGVPQFYMAVTRSADIKKTPDIRTRALLPHWACFLDITYPTPMIEQQSVLNLLAVAGMFSGVGDNRTEKGSANYGSFRLAEAHDPELKNIIKHGRRATQVTALDKPVMYDDETESLFTWYCEQVESRSKQRLPKHDLSGVVVPDAKTKRNGRSRALVPA